MKSKCSPSLPQSWLSKVLSNQINSINKRLSDKLPAFLLGVLLSHLPGSLCAAPLQLVVALGHGCLRAEHKETILPTPFTLYCAFGVGRKEGEREGAGPVSRNVSSPRDTPPPGGSLLQ
jgi:hypothetical protein